MFHPRVIELYKVIDIPWFPLGRVFLIIINKIESISSIDDEKGKLWTGTINGYQISKGNLYIIELCSSRIQSLHDERCNIRIFASNASNSLFCERVPFGDFLLGTYSQQPWSTRLETRTLFKTTFKEKTLEICQVRSSMFESLDKTVERKKHVLPLEKMTHGLLKNI